MTSIIRACKPNLLYPCQLYINCRAIGFQRLYQLFQGKLWNVCLNSVHYYQQYNVYIA